MAASPKPNRRKAKGAEMPVPAGAPSANRARVATVAVMVGVVAFLVFTRSLENGFLNWDDDVYVTANPYIRSGLTVESIRWAFDVEQTRAANWHPLTWLSHAADISLFGLDAPWGHHLTSILLHAVNACLLVVVLVRLTGRLWLSAIVGLLFALHPLHVESVSWVAERKDVLCTMFLLLSLWAYAWYAAKPSLGRYGAVVLAFAAALASKPLAVTLPFVLLLVDWWPLGRLSWRTVAEKAPLVAMSAASSAVTIVVQQRAGAVQQLIHLDFGRRVAEAVYAYGTYLVRTVWPYPGTLVPLVPLPELGGPAIGTADMIVYGLILAAITVAAVLLRRSRPYLLVGWLIFLGVLVPMIGLVKVGDQLMADRYTYVPMIGLLVALVWLADYLFGRRHRRVLGAVGVVVLVALAALTWQQQGVWHDSVTFWTRSAEAFPKSASGHCSLGNAYREEGDTTRAVEHGRKAVALAPRNAIARTGLGLSLLLADKTDDAEAEFRAAVELNPDLPGARYGLGRARLKKGDLGGAVAQLRRAVELDPWFLPARTNLASALLARGDVDEAIPLLRRLAEEAPNEAYIRQNLGVALLQKGRAKEAVEHLAAAVRLAPDDWQARENLGIALVQSGRTADAVEEFRAATRLNPRRPESYVHLGRALQAIGRKQEADQCFAVADRLLRERSSP